MTRRRHTLRGRIVLTIIGRVFATSLIFGFATFLIAYSMEDRLFRRALDAEVGYQQAAWQRTGAMPVTKNPNITIYRRDQALPPDLQQEFAANPRQTVLWQRWSPLPRRALHPGG